MPTDGNQERWFDLFKQAVMQSFNCCAHSYAPAAGVLNEVGLRLLQRLDYMTLQPETVLDLGCGPGARLSDLSARYPVATVIGLDIAQDMLSVARATHANRLVCADMQALPFANESIDLVFANQVLYWSQDLPGLLAEIHRVIRPGGCLMFSVLGLDSYHEVQGVHLLTHPEYMHALFDMHPVGDALLAAEFIEPVVDMQPLVGQYFSQDALLAALRAQGLTARAKPAGNNSLSYEVIYGQAWRGAIKQTQYGQDVFVPVDILRKSRS